VEQLQSFHPMVGDYRTAGIEMVAIGLDTVAGARESLENLAPADQFDFPLLSDRKLRVFREWLAFDEFEHMPLHGTFLIDADGRLRWQEIGPLPFEEPAWLLGECKRLLRQAE
jgi:peroxiredoxin